MRQWFALLAEGGDPMHAKLIHTHTIATASTATLDPIYQAEIEPYVTYGDFSKLYVVIFENNTASGNRVDAVFFSAGVDITATNSNTRNGGIIRADYTNIRSLILSYDAYVSAGTVLKIYEFSI